MINVIKNELFELTMELEKPNLSKKEISEIKKEIKIREKELKTLEKEQEKNLNEALLSVKTFFTLIASNCSFESVMEDALSLSDDKSSVKFLLYPINNNILIYPLNSEDTFMKSYIKININEENKTKFTDWIMLDDNPVIFTLGDYNMFRKLSLTPGKKGVKMVIDKIYDNIHSYKTAGHFYIDGNEDIAWEHEFKRIEKQSLDIYNDSDFETNIIFDKDQNLKYTENDEIVVEMTSDMIRIWQKNDANYKILSGDTDISGFSTIVIASFSLDNTFSIYQQMNVIRYKCN